MHSLQVRVRPRAEKGWYFPFAAEWPVPFELAGRRRTAIAMRSCVRAVAVSRAAITGSRPSPSLCLLMSALRG